MIVFVGHKPGEGRGAREREREREREKRKVDTCIQPHLQTHTQLAT